MLDEYVRKPSEKRKAREEQRRSGKLNRSREEARRKRQQDARDAKK